MTYSLDFELPGLPKMNTANGGNWKTGHYERKRWHKRVAQITMGRRPREPLERAQVTVTRYSGHNAPDFENLTQGGKALIDGLVKCGIIVDDKPSVIGQPVYEWEKAKRGEGRVRVRVTSAGGEG